MTSLTQQWLRQVAQPYHSKDRVYADVDAVLAAFATLRPKTEVYTFNDGRTQLLICVHGLVPITYRQATYNIPISLWIPSGYPREPPLAYVVPTSDMFVRASKAVDPSGQCDIEYLRNWQRKSEGCDLIALVRALQDQFSREPPVYAKPRSSASGGGTSQLSTNPSTAGPSHATRPPPPLPGSQSVPVTTTSTPISSIDRPALPTKPISHSPSPSIASHPNGSPSAALRPLDAPVRPPLPPDLRRPWAENHPSPPPTSRPPRAEQTPRPASAYATIPQQYDGRSNDQPPAFAYTQPQPGATPGHPPYHVPGPVSTHSSGQSMQWQSTSQQLSSPTSWSPSPPPPPPNYGSRPASIHVSTFSHPPAPFSPSQHVTHPPPHAPAIPPPAAAPIPDLMDDDTPEPSVNPAVPAPPRPPNPELLRLHAAVRSRIHAELGSLATAANADAERMRVTQADLLAGEPAIRDEMARLEAVKDVCRTVASRYRDCVSHAEANIAELRRKGDPEVDELVCSTTIVHNQLINLIAEDNAIEDTIYHLHRALNAGRIDLDKFLKTTRLLAEEQFTKRALIERILAGLPTGASSWT
ncbi:UEV-domain-containing protein [Exidia glandulosa HHB12029]|uniref:UEV-domain-containing protein n=1 Tax=Exidia glandulosa HHB12029 TaxID=1314781 RepID=A0A165GVM1_EXIGL|nr:UEV-domain-containing protein [Exidia glandulosa HHB12029]